MKSNSNNMVDIKNFTKHKSALLQKYLSIKDEKKQGNREKDGGGSLVISNESFQVPTKYQALREIVSEFKIKKLGFWGCNISN